MTIKFPTKIIMLLVLMVVFVVPVFVDAQEFVPIAPGVPDEAINTDSINNTGSPDEYFRDLFILFVSVATILGVIKLMICGIQYMTSESISTKGAAKSCISAVIGGLSLVLLSFLILQTINEDFVDGGFDIITNSIQNNLGDVTNLKDNVALDGDSDGSDLPADSSGAGYGFSYKGTSIACNPEETTRSVDNYATCLLMQKEAATFKIYMVEELCANNGSGKYTYTLTNNCSGNNLSMTFNTKGACNDSADEFLNINAYTIIRTCHIDD